MDGSNTLERKRRAFAPGYSDEEIPLASYAGFLGLFGAAFVTLLATSNRGGRRLPQRIPASDLLLMGVATHKITRIVTRDWVTSPIRAPFTSYRGSSGAGEVKERSRGSGLQKATGELLTCPWCFAPWTASALTFGLVNAPRTTRLIGSIFTTVAISDVLQHGYGALRKVSQKSGKGGG